MKVLAGLLTLCLMTVPAIAAEQTFNVPKQHNVRIDNCLQMGGPCGQSVADAYCKTKGFIRASQFSVSDTTTPTIYLGSTTQCSSRVCRPFDRIRCTDSLNVNATSSTDIGDVKP